MNKINFLTIKKYKVTLPFFLYDFNKIRRQYLNLKKFLPKNFHIFYSVKANPNIQILKILKNLNSGAEISSSNELKNVLKVGFSRKKIIFVSPGKADEELKFALKNKIYLIIVESLEEIKRINKIATKLKIKQNILIRINPVYFDPKSDAMFSMIKVL